MKQFLLIICLVLLLVVTVIPAFASPSISAISPTTALNNRDITMTITGTGFNADSTVWIDTPASTESIPGTIISRSPTAITCTFSIQGTTPARYNVWVNSPFTDMAGTDDDRYTIPAIDGVQWTVAVNGGRIYSPAPDALRGWFVKEPRDDNWIATSSGTIQIT